MWNSGKPVFQQQQNTSTPIILVQGIVLLQIKVIKLLHFQDFVNEKGAKPAEVILFFAVFANHFGGIFVA